RIDRFFVVERNWLELKDGFARVVHWPDLVFETCGGSLDTKFTSGSDQNLPARYRNTRNAGNEGRALRALCAETNYARLAGFAFVIDIDVVAAAGDVLSSQIAHCDVAAAGCIPQSEMTK